MVERDDPSMLRRHDNVSGGVDHGVQAQRIRGGVHFYSDRVRSSSPVPHQLPLNVKHFTGRVEELRNLDEILESARTEQDPSVVISVIAATAGMGKTSLAIHWAHRVSKSFPDGELYVNLHGYDPCPPLTAEQALGGFLRALDVPHETILNSELDVLSGLYRSILANRRMLILLDNAISAEQVRPLLPGSPTCVVLVTSRDLLGGLKAHDGAHRISLDRLSSLEEIKLLQNIIGSRLFDGKPDAAAELSRLCCHLPLALCIAAVRIADQPHLSVTDLLGELRSADRPLEIFAVDEDDRTAIRSVFSWSYRTLASDVARIFRLFGLFPGHEIGLHAVAVLTGTPLPTARRLLARLASAHMVEESSKSRYRFHDLLRAYAVERAIIEELPQERRGAVNRTLSWYLHTAALAIGILRVHGQDVQLGELSENLSPLSFNSRDEALQWLEQESGNLLASIHYAAKEGHHILAWQLPVVLTDLLWRQNLASIVPIYQRALDAAIGLCDRAGVIWVLNNLGDINLDLGNFADAIAYFDRMLQISLDIGDRFFEGHALNGFGLAHLRQQNWDRAVEYLRRAIDSFDDVKNAIDRANALANLGDALRGMRKYDESIECCLRSLEIFRKLGSRGHEAGALRILGWIYLDLRKYDSSIRKFREALAIDRDFGNIFDEARSQNSIGNALYLAGRSKEARRAWLMAFKIFEALGLPQAEEVRARLGSSPSAHEE